MKSLLSIVCVSLLVSSCCWGDDSSTSSDVITLDANNFDKALEDNPLILVEFYAPWCGHCKHLAPEYEKAATELKALSIPIAKMNADEEINKPVAQRVGVRGFPTLKLYRNGVASDYSGGRTAADIVNFMKRQAMPAITHLTTAEDVRKFQTQGDVVVVGFFDKAEGADYNGFKALSDKLRDEHSFADVIGLPDVAKEFEVTVPSVVVFKTFDEKKNVITADQFEELQKWVSAAATPTIAEISQQNYQKYAASDLPLGYLFIDPKVPGQKDQYLAELYDVATATKGKMHWVWVDWNKFAKHAERVGLSGKVVPSVAMERIKDAVHFGFDETKAVTKADVQAWVNGVLDGSIKATVRSEEIPADNSGPVKVVVAHSFSDIVLDSKKDVLLEFYAPWCGHCKHLAPIYEELGTKLKGIESVVIAKMDATANDVDGKYGVKGFPTLKFFPANNKDEPIEFDGDRTVDSFISFIKTHASIPFNPPTVHDEL